MNLRLKYVHLLVGFVAGVLAGFLLAGAFVGKDVAGSLKLLKQGALERRRERVDEAYYKKTSSVAEWELKNFVELLKEYSAREFESESILEFYLFLSYGRLARLYEEQGMTDQASTYAIKALKHVPDDKAESVTNSVSLFSIIEKIDLQFEQTGSNKPARTVPAL